MAAQVNYFIELQPADISERLQQLAPYKIPLAIKAGFDTAIPEVISAIKNDRLSGKGPFPPAEHRLGVVTGLLRSSVFPIKSTMEVSEDSCTIRGGIQVVGVPYANVHEFGFVGDESVAAHSRRYIRVRTKSKRTGSLLKRPMRTTTTGAVRAYTRKMNIPARAPFRTGMSENLIRIRGAIQKSIAAALENV